MHRFYRSCLTKAFIVPQRNKTESPSLSSLQTTQYGAAYHLLAASTGVVLDRSGLEGVPAGQQFEHGCEPDLRVVDSFLFSQSYCGSQITGYAKTEEYEKWIYGSNNRIDLAEAVAISGAAISPSQIHNWFVAFLMVALNVRLGQWIPNPRRGRPGWGPTAFTLLRELRRPARDRSYCFVTDGGNSENLGLIQLLLRRCTLIIQIDAGQDSGHSFNDLGRTIRLARMHAGVRFVSLDNSDHEFTTDSLQLRKLDPDWRDQDDGGRNCEQHYACARILYPDGTKGLLVYVKPSFTGDESIDLQQYRKRCPSFPHEPTSDQVYDADQVESYRELGEHIASTLCNLFVKGHRTLWEHNLTTEEVCATLAPNWRADTSPQSATSSEVDSSSVLQKVADAGEPMPDQPTTTVTPHMPEPTVTFDPPGVFDDPVNSQQIPPSSHFTSAELATAVLARSNGSPPEDHGHREALQELRLLSGHMVSTPQTRELLAKLLVGLSQDPDPGIRRQIVEQLADMYAPMGRQRKRIRHALAACAEGDACPKVRQDAKQTLRILKLLQKKRR